VPHTSAKTKTILALSILVALTLLVTSPGSEFAIAQTPTVVATNPNFNISANPSSFIVLAGSTQGSTIKLTSIAKYNGTVNLSDSTTNTGVTASFGSTSLIVKYNQAPTTTLTIVVASTTVSGQYNVIVTGKSTDGSLTHAISISVEVVKPDFAISAFPSWFSIVAGTTLTSTIKVSPVQRFNGTVNLSCSPDTGVTAKLASSSVSIKFNQSATTTISIGVPSTASAGKYNIIVTGQNSGGTLSHSVNIVLQVIQPDFSINTFPSSLSIAAGYTGTSLIRLYSLDRFNGTVSLTATPPAGWSKPLFARSTLKLTYNNNNSTEVTISVPAQASPGQYPVTITGQSTSGIIHSTTLNVRVLNPNFVMYASPSSLNIVSGTKENSTIHVYGTDRFNGTVTLSASSPTGWSTPTFLLSSLWIDYAHSNSTVLSISVPSGTPSGQYIVTVGGLSGLTTHAIALKVQVLNPDFSMSAAPSTLYLIAGTSGGATIHLNPINRFNGTVTLTAQSPKGWTTPTFLQPQVTIDYAHSGSTVMTVSVPQGTFDGKYEITVTGTSGKLSHTITLTVQVITPAIALQASPSLTTIPSGSAGNITIYVVALGRYNGTITMSATPPDSWTTTFYKPTLTVAYNQSTNSTKLQIAVPTGTAPGKYTMCNNPLEPNKPLQWNSNPDRPIT